LPHTVAMDANLSGAAAARAKAAAAAAAVTAATAAVAAVQARVNDDTRTSRNQRRPR
jgi:hypothetical protein